MSANEKAEAVLIVIKKILKWILFAALALTAIVIVIIYWSKASDWYETGRHEAKIKVTGGFNLKECSKEMPLMLTITNDSSRTVEKMTIYVDVTKEGRSTKINNYSDLLMDYILAPGKKVSLCWGVLEKDTYKVLSGEGMAVTIDHFYTTFKAEK